MPAQKWALPLLLVHALLVQVISYSLRPTISYAMIGLGYDGPWLGLATASFAVPPLLLAVTTGRITDRFGERVPLVIGGAALLAAALMALLFQSSVIGLLIATALLGLGVLFSVLGEQAWVMRGAANGRLDHIFGIYTFATSTGQMLGPLLLAAPGEGGRPPLDLIFTTNAALALVAMLLACVTRPSLAAVRVPQGGGNGTSVWQLLRVRGVPGALISSSLMLTSLDLLLAYLPQYAEERGFAPTVLSLMLVVRGVATMLSRLLLAKLTGRFGRRTVLVVSGIVAGVSLMAYMIDLPAAALVGLMAAFGFALGTVQPLTMSWVTLITEPRDRGVAASLRIVGNRLGQTAIPLAVAPLSLAGGAATVLLATGASLMAAAWLSRLAPNDGDETSDAGQ